MIGCEIKLAHSWDGVGYGSVHVTKSTPCLKPCSDSFDLVNAASVHTWRNSSGKLWSCRSLQKATCNPTADHIVKGDSLPFSGGTGITILCLTGRKFIQYDVLHCMPFWKAQNSVRTKQCSGVARDGPSRARPDQLCCTKTHPCKQMIWFLLKETSFSWKPRESSGNSPYYRF